MIRILNGEPKTFVLDTERTSYIFAVTESGHLEHLWYGAKLAAEQPEDCAAFREKKEFEIGNGIVYSKLYPKVMLEDMCLEMSSGGHGDVREPFAELVYPDGSRSSDFLFDSFEISGEPPVYENLPLSHTDREEHLCVTLKDGDLTLELHYRVFADCDVIARSARLINGGKDPVRVERLMSLQLDLPVSGCALTSFHGAWIREMNRSTVTLDAGKYVVESRTGSSSNRANPFVMLHEPDACEHSGSVYGFNLIYSGNHYTAAEVNAYGKTRLVSGIQPQGFSWLLEEGERFETPEAVMTYSPEGFTGQSVNMHRFVREHVIREEWKNKPRPVLLNSWEACYFDISERKLCALAKAGKELGMELFVMDDGWFGERDDDTSSLGDWEPNPKKLPNGLKGLGEKLAAMDIQFGVWVEPEMVNTESKLYKAHPDWAMAIPGKHHSEGRTQRVLDLANPAVQDFLTEKMTEVFSSADIAYVKWDMNRIFSDVYSPYLPPQRQGETAHRYILGLYRIIRTLTGRFPNILFEGCAAGGNRFDLGILRYFPQIWGSDNSDAICRVTIQEGYSYGYPQSCIGAHVSAVPNHQTLRVTPEETRFNVAAFGALGYECDLRDLNAAQRQEITEQIALYKQWREVFQFGQLYRVLSGNLHEWICVSEDKKRAVGMILQEKLVPNTQTQRFYAAGLLPNQRYRLRNIPGRVDVKQFGSLINTVAPIHVKQDSLVHNVIAKTVKMNRETEDVSATGDVLMHTGVSLSPTFSATGFNDKVRVFPDFSSRLYLIEAIES